MSFDKKYPTRKDIRNWDKTRCMCTRCIKGRLKYREAEKIVKREREKEE